MIIARPEHRRIFERRLKERGIDTQGAIAREQLRFYDAEETLGKFMQNGQPDWTAFHTLIGGVIAEMRLHYSAVRAYGEMVDILWQKGERDAAIHLEEFWNELGRLQTFALFCAYHLDHLDAKAYDGALERICHVHTHLIPVRDYARFDEAVQRVSERVLEQPVLAEVRAHS